MNARERLLIEALYDTQNEAKRNAGVTLFFYSRNKKDVNGKSVSVKSQYAVMMENIVRKYFSGEKYCGRFREVYDTFVTEFYKYLLSLSKDKFLEADNFESYLFVCVSNFCKNQSRRRAIDAALGIDEEVSLFTVYDEPINEDQLVEQPATDNDKDSASRIKIPDHSDDDDGDDHWAEELLDYYINQIQNEYYRLVLRVIMLGRMSREDFAEEQGKKLSAIYNDISRAMDALIRVALPDIRFRTKSMFKKYQDELSREDVEILNRFYEGNATDMDSKSVVKAYSDLLKIARTSGSDVASNV